MCLRVSRGFTAGGRRLAGAQAPVAQQLPGRPEARLGSSAHPPGRAETTAASARQGVAPGRGGGSPGGPPQWMGRKKANESRAGEGGDSGAGREEKGAGSGAELGDGKRRVGGSGPGPSSAQLQPRGGGGGGGPAGGIFPQQQESPGPVDCLIMQFRPRVFLPTLGRPSRATRHSAWLMSPAPHHSASQPCSQVSAATAVCPAAAPPDPPSSWPGRKDLVGQVEKRAGAPRRPWLRAGGARRPPRLPGRHPSPSGFGARAPGKPASSLTHRLGGGCARRVRAGGGAAEEVRRGRGVAGSPASRLGPSAFRTLSPPGPRAWPQRGQLSRGRTRWPGD